MEKGRSHKFKNFLSKFYSVSLRILVGILIFLFLLIGSLVAAWQFQFTRKGVISIGLSIASQFLDGKLELESLDGNLFSYLELREGRWLDRNGREMAGFSYLYAEYDLLKLFKNTELFFRKVILSKPRGYLFMDREGNINLLQHIKTSDSSEPEPEPTPPKEESGSSKPFLMRIQHFHITDLEGKFIIEDSIELSAKNAEFAGSFFLSTAGPLIEIKLSRSQFSGKIPFPFVCRSLTVGQFLFLSDASKMTVKGFSLDFGRGSHISLDGEMLLSPIHWRATIKKYHLLPEDIPYFPEGILFHPIAGTISADGGLGKNQVSLTAQTAGSSIAIDGTVDIIRQDYDLKLKVKSLNLAKLLKIEAIDSLFNLSAKIWGKGFIPSEMNTRFILRLTRSRFQNYRIRSSFIRGKLRKNWVYVDKLRLLTPYGRIWSKNRVFLGDGRLRGVLTAYLPSLRRVGRLFGLKMSGQASVRFYFSGQNWLPVGRLVVGVKNFRGFSTRLRRADIRARIHSLVPVKLDLSVDARRTELPNLYFHRLQTALRYQLNRYQKIYLRRLKFSSNIGNFHTVEPAHISVFSEYIQVKNLKLAQGTQRLHVLNGVFNWKKYKFNVRVIAKRLLIEPFLRAFVPDYQMKGRLSLDLKGSGYVTAPRWNLSLRLDDFRYQKLPQVSVAISSTYPRMRGKTPYVHLDLSAFYSGGGKRENFALVRGVVPLALYRRGGFRVFDHRPLELTVALRDFDLGWLRDFLQLPVDGHLNFHLKVARSLRHPAVILRTVLKGGRWEKYTGVDLTFGARYSRGELTVRGGETSQRYASLSMKGRKLLSLGGKLPVKLYFQTGKSGVPQFFWRLYDRSVRFELKILKNRLAPYIRLVSDKLYRDMAYLDGLFSGFFKLGGKFSRPEFEFRLDLDRVSFCPWLKGEFRCRIAIPDYRLFSTRKGQKRRRRFIKTRIHGSKLFFAASYKPVSTDGWGTLDITSKLFVPPALIRGRELALRKVLKISGAKLIPFMSKKGRLEKGAVPRRGRPSAKRYSGTARVEKFGTAGPKTMALLELSPLRLRAQLGFDVEKMKPQLVLGDYIDLGFKIFRSSISGLYLVFRMPILKKLAGFLGMELSVRGKLSDPFVKFKTFVSDAVVNLSSGEEDNPLALKGLNLNFSVFMKNRILISEFRSSLFKRTLFSVVTILKERFRLGFDPSSYRVILSLPHFASFIAHLPEFSLEELAPYFGLEGQLRGKIKGHFELYGNPACIKFTSNRRSSYRTNYLAVEDFYIGMPYREFSSLLKKGKREFTLPALRFKKFLLQLSPAGGNSLKIKLNAWSPRRSLRRSGDLLQGILTIPLPLSLWGKRSDSCGKVDEKRALFVEVGSLTGIPLKFIEAFSPNIIADIWLKIRVRIQGTLQEPKIDAGRIGLKIKRIAHRELGLEIKTDWNKGKLRKYCKFKILGGNKRLHIRGCSYSFVNIFLEPSKYRVELRLQGRTGSPLLFYGHIPHKNFLPQLSKKRLFLKLEASEFKPMETPNYALTLKANILMTGYFDRPVVRGKIVIPRLLYTLPEVSHKPGSFEDNPDIIVLGEKGSQGLPSESAILEEKGGDSWISKLDSEIQIVIPRNFKVRNREINIEARTDEFRDLWVKLKGGNLQLIGGIEIVRGELSFYTRKFTVLKDSKVNFLGQSVPLSDLSGLDASLSLAAQYLMTVSPESSLAKNGHKRVKILLFVKGTIKSPKIELEVRDALTDQKLQIDKIGVITLILLGTTPEDLAGGQSKGLANQALGYFSKALASSIRSTLSSVVPLDVLKIETGARSEDLKLEIGKYLTPELYFQLMAKPAPIEDENYWEALLNYAITRKFSLELKIGQKKRQNFPIFRGGAHVFFQTRLGKE